jgi:hypothetical protein
MAAKVFFGVALLAFAFLVSEFVLPRVAVDRVTEELERNGGEVREVEVDAFPALKLLFGRADRVEADLVRLRATGTGRLAELIDKAEGTDEVRGRTGELTVGTITVTDASMEKDGPLLRGSATITRDALTDAIPFASVRVDPRVEPDGSLVLEGSASVFGTTVSATARLGVADGAIVIAPEGLLGSFGTVTVFRDERLRVDAVTAAERGDGFVLTAEGRLTSS